MRRILAVIAAGGCLLTLLVSPVRAIDDAASGERIGVRVGYVDTSDGLYAAYGAGWDLTLYFTERVYSKMLLDIRLGAIYLGDAKNPNLDDQITNTPGVVSEMRMLYFSVGPMVGMTVGQNYSGYLSAGIGVYSVSMLFASTVQAFDYSDQHIGFNGGVGLSRRIATNWTVELSGTVHYFPVDTNNTDLYWVFTDHADSPVMLGVALGATVDLR